MAIARFDDVVQTAQGQAIAGAKVYILTQPADVDTLTPLATVYSSLGGAPGDNPQTTDGLGEIGCYLDNGQLYTLVVQAPQILQQVYPDQAIGSGGSTGSTPFAQTPAGAIDGTNRNFTLTVHPSLLLLVQNTSLLSQGLGYTTAVVAGVFTITLAQAPEPGDTLNASGIV